MNLFDKKFVYLEWNDCLKGKQVVLGDTLGELRKKLNMGLVVPVVKNEGDYPFTPADSIEINYALCYYDPNYSCKVAYAQGKQIQARDPMVSAEWMDVKEPMWYAEQEYRVKPEEHMFHVYKSSDETIHLSKSGAIFEGTEEERRQYIKEHYCDKCAHQSCMIEAGTQFCIKPEKVLKPFKDVGELRKAWSIKQTGRTDIVLAYELAEPMIWVRDKERPDITRLITDFNGGINSVALAGQWHSLETLFEQYEFIDGTPCGVLVSVVEEKE